MMSGNDALYVSCYSGFRADEEPRSFRYGARVVEVREIVDRWLDPGCRGFRVRGDDGLVYILRQDPGTGRWTLTN